MNFKIKKINKGFTVIELLIAMAGFSFVLLLVTIVMMNIGSIYSKGINQTKIDDAARYITDDISRQIKFSKPIDLTQGSSGKYCIGGIMYSFNLNTKPSSITYALKRSFMSPGASCLSDPPASGEELVPANAQLSSFEIINTTGVYSIKVSLYYGDSANLQSPTPGYDSKCKPTSSYQYCAVTQLTTVATPRIN
jgi:hypothetical protein